MKKILCSLFGHKYKQTQKICPGVYELHCKRCKEEFALNQSVKALVPLDDEIRELNRELKHDHEEIQRLRREGWQFKSI